MLRTLPAVTTSTLAPVQDLNLLRTFLAVHRAGSFTAAAPALGLTQPTVTTQMRALEQQLGRQLFQRLPRGVEPTPFARELAERISAPLDDLDLVAGGNCELDGRTWAARVESRAARTPVCAALESVPLVSTADDMPVVRRYWRTQYGKQHPAAVW